MDKNNRDEEMLLRLQKAFREDAESIETPESLSKENITALLRDVQPDNVVPLSGARRKPKNPLPRIAAIAASFVLVMAVAVVARHAHNSNDLGLKGAFEGFKIDNLVKSITSKEELDRAVSEIIGGNKKAENSPADTAGEAAPAQPADKETAEPAIVVEKPAPANVVSNKGFEADIVKYSGGYLYVLTPAIDGSTGTPTQVIKVIKTSPSGEMQESALIELRDAGMSASSDECFEIQIKGSTLIALIGRKDYSGSDSGSDPQSSTLTLFYDISNPEAPSLMSTRSQDGAFAASDLKGDTLWLVTTGTLSNSNPVPSITEDGSRYDLSADRDEITACENARENAYLLIGACNINRAGEGTSVLELIGCGANSGISISGSGVYISRQFAAVDTGDKRTEIYHVASEGGKLTLAGTYSLDGTLPAGINAQNDSGVYYIRSDSGKLYAGALTKDLKKINEETDLGLDGNSACVFIGNTAYVAGGETGRAVRFSGGEITVSDAPAHRADSAIYRITDKSVIEICAPGKNGATVINCYGSDGASSSYSFTKGERPLLSDSRAILIDSERGIFGIPVIIPGSNTESSAYILFAVSGGKIEKTGEYIHDGNYIGDAATRAALSGNILYTVSGAKITAFTLSDAKAQAAYIY